jgi:hypothetical protein
MGLAPDAWVRMADRIEPRGDGTAESIDLRDLSHWRRTDGKKWAASPKRAVSPPSGRTHSAQDAWLGFLLLEEAAKSSQGIFAGLLGSRGRCAGGAGLRPQELTGKTADVRKKYRV